MSQTSSVTDLRSPDCGANIRSVSASWLNALV